MKSQICMIPKTCIFGVAPNHELLCIGVCNGKNCVTYGVVRGFVWPEIAPMTSVFRISSFLPEKP